MKDSKMTDEELSKAYKEYEEERQQAIDDREHYADYSDQEEGE